MKNLSEEARRSASTDLKGLPPKSMGWVMCVTKTSVPALSGADANGKEKERKVKLGFE